MNNNAAHHANIALHMYLTNDYVNLIDQGKDYLDKPHLLFWLAALSYHVLLADGINFSDLFAKPSKENWLWLGIASIAGFIGGNFFSVINLKTAGERTNSLLSPAITACAVAASALVFNEPMNFIKLTSIIITLTAIAAGGCKCVLIVQGVQTYLISKSFNQNFTNSFICNFI
jgi:hypothetical protein